jgi:hypothetical protein
MLPLKLAVMAWHGVSSTHLSERLRLLAGYNNSMRNSRSCRFVRVIEERGGGRGASGGEKKKRKDEITA